MTDTATLLEKRFTPEPMSGCWLWTGSLNDDGYARIHINRKNTSAHRLAYQTYVGPIPSGLELDHLCRQPCCINPSHLEPVTHKVNTQRAAKAAWEPYCKRGHPRIPENTWYTTKGHPYCRECALSRGRLAYRRRKANG